MNTSLVGIHYCNQLLVMAFVPLGLLLTGVKIWIIICLIIFLGIANIIANNQLRKIIQEVTKR